MKYTIGHLSLNVEEQGAGQPTLVFLHYWGGSLRTWDAVVANLAGSHHCVAYDIRGWGKSDPAGSYSLSDMASEAASPTPVRFPEEIRQQQIHAYDNRETVLQTLGFLSARPPALEIQEQIVADSLGASREAVLAWPNIALLEDISADVPNIDVPTLILAGEEDHLDSIEQHRNEVQSRIPNARLEVICGSGHLIPIDEPVQLSQAIEKFVASLRITTGVGQ